MKRALFFLLLLALPVSLAAQNVVQTTPQNVQRRVFNAVNTAQVSAALTNIGQNVHLLTYTCSNPACQIRIRLEASNDGATFFPISEDVTDVASGAAFSFGYFPVIRVNLVSFTAGLGTVTAYYAGTSAQSKPPSGIFNASQNYRKFVMSGSAGTTQSVYISPPFGTAGGFLWITSTGFPANSTIGVQARRSSTGGTQNVIANYPLTAAGVTITIPPHPATQLLVTYTAGGASANSFEIWYFFTPVVIPFKQVGGSEVTGSATYALPEPAFVCNQSAVITIAAGATVKVVTESGTKTVHICHISVSYDAATNFQLIQGTGAACGTGTANLTGNYLDLTAIGLDFAEAGALRPAAGNGVCVVTSAAVNGGGVITYAQF